MPLDAIDPTWINAPAGVGPTYDSEELRRDLGFLLAGGATADVSRTGVLDARGLTVTLSGSNVQINPGGAAVGSSKGAYLSGAKATATIDALAAADVTNPRRDRVVMEILDPDNGGSAGRKAQFRVITGTPDANALTGGGFPAAPALSITLAHVDVPKVGGGSPSVTRLAPITVAAGAPVPVSSKAEADALPKWDGALRLRLDFPGRPLEVCNGTVWKHLGPWVRTDFNIADLVNASGTASRLVGDLALGTKPYARKIRLAARMAVNPAAIASGVSTVYAAVSLLQSNVLNSQGLMPMSWTSPGAYLQSAYVTTPEIVVPANVDPLARLWVYVASGSITTTVSSDARITQFWAEEKPDDA